MPIASPQETSRNYYCGFPSRDGFRFLNYDGWTLLGCAKVSLWLPPPPPPPLLLLLLLRHNYNVIKMMINLPMRTSPWHRSRLQSLHWHELVLYLNSFDVISRIFFLSHSLEQHFRGGGREENKVTTAICFVNHSHMQMSMIMSRGLDSSFSPTPSSQDGKPFCGFFCAFFVLNLHLLFRATVYVFKWQSC